MSETLEVRMSKILITVLLVVVVAAGVPAQQRMEYVGTYEVQQIGRLRGNFRNAELRMPVPGDRPTQTITGVALEPDSAELVTGEGEQLRTARLQVAGPARSASMTISYRVACSQEVFDAERLAGRRYEQYDTSSDIYKRFTGPGMDVESDDARITSIGESIAEDHASAFERARAVYEYVLGHSQYEKERAASALQMLSLGRGNCTGYANLFVAICRAAGIPARVIRGYVIGGTPPWHSWCEFYLPEVGWVPADPTNGDQAAHTKELYFCGLAGRPYVVFTKGPELSAVADDDTRGPRRDWAGSAQWQGSLRMEFELVAREVSAAKFCILLHSGGQEREVSVGLNAAELEEAIGTARREGRAPVSLAVAAQSEEPIYGVVWQSDKSSGNWQLYAKLSQQELERLVHIARGNGMMPVALASCRLQSGEELYAAAFAPAGEMSWSAVVGESQQQFAQTLNTKLQSGYIPAIVAGHTRGKEAVMSAVFVRYGASAGVSTGLFAQKDQLDAKLAEYEREGYLPITLAVTDATPPYYHVVGVRSGAQRGWEVIDDVTAAEVEGVLADAAADGLQPVAICAY